MRSCAAAAVWHGRQVDTGFFGSAFVGRRLSPGALGLVLAAHALALWTLAVQRQAAPELVEHSLLVSLVVPEPVVQPVAPPKLIRPQPRPVEKKAVVQQPLAAPEPQLAAQAPAESPAPAVEAPTLALPAVPEPVPVRSEPAQVAPAAVPPTDPVPAEPAVEDPRYNADYLNNPAPGYPSLSRRLREEGRVLLRVRVDVQGNATQVNLHQSSGFSRLDERAEETVRRWKFVPARRGGEAVEAWVIVPIQFSLKGK